MARIAFINIPAHGHTNPTLPLVSELSRRGHTVDYWTFGSFAPAVERAGAVVHDYEALLPFDYTRLDTNLFRLAAFLLEATQRILPPLAQQVAVTAPDMIIHDSLATWGRGVAHLLHLPAACSVTTFAMNNRVVAGAPTQVRNLLAMAPGALHRLPAFLQTRAALRKTFGLAVPNILSIFTNPQPLNVVYTSPAVQPGAESFDSSWRFVGATLSAERLAECWPPETEGHVNASRSDRPLIFVSLGTLFNEAPAFYRLCLEAARGAPWEMLIAVGEKVDRTSLGALPANVRVEPFVPQVGVLHRASLFITHAGMNSAHEALLAGVPTLLTPQAADQEWVAQRLARLGAGRMMRTQRMAAPELRALIDGALADASMRARARALGVTLREAGGPPAAADALEAYLAASSQTS